MNVDAQIECRHDDVLVDYAHPYVDFEDVRVEDLKASDPDNTRPIKTLLNPRCAKCGSKLKRSDLKMRICESGDLYDPRFRWVIPRRIWWWSW